jgi:transposase
MAFPRNNVVAVKQVGCVEYILQKENPMTERRVYTDEFKRDAVRLAKERGNTSEVARDLGIHESLLSKWKRQLQAAPQRPFPGHGNPADLEMAQLKRENARLKEENEILKKAVGIFTVRPL